MEGVIPLWGVNSEGSFLLYDNGDASNAHGRNVRPSAEFCPLANFESTE